MPHAAEGSTTYCATLRVWDEDACRRIHAGTLRVLAETGVEIHDAVARELCAGAGARDQDLRVCLPAALVQEALDSAPGSALLPSRGAGTPAIELTPGPTYFGTGPDCLYVTDPASGERRRGALADVAAAAALAEHLANIDFVMSMALPADVDAAGAKRARRRTVRAERGLRASAAGTPRRPRLEG